MATRYDEIIKLRAGKAAYNIAEEKEGEWESFIPNKQFDYVLKTVLKSVRGNDIDNLNHSGLTVPMVQERVMP